MPKSSNIIYANTDALAKMSSVFTNYPSAARTVMNRVLQRTTSAVKAETSRQVPSVFGASEKDIRSALGGSRRKVRPVLGVSGEGSISIEVLGRPITVSRFEHTPGKPVFSSPYQPTVTIFRSKGMVPLGPARDEEGKIKPVFLAPNKRSGGSSYLFFYRTAKRNAERVKKPDAKGPEMIKAIRTLSIPQMVLNERVSEGIVKKVDEIVDKRLIHELDYEFGNLGTNLKAGGTL